ncbi:Carboxypeptidase Q [Anabarilius grahami]|uniref:Carboxypeptidase Q n=1 Tax=Anabarilius grahami TaxID=495550 RepID=A0A3N0YQN4_ANAGA|nr:Carboxypeptidase Q [Anabarilius grahami]
MESDLGTFSPLGLQFTGSDKARAIMKEVMKLLAAINVTSLEEHGEGTDINMWMKAGVPDFGRRRDWDDRLVKRDGDVKNGGEMIPGSRRATRHDDEQPGTGDEQLGLRSGTDETTTNKLQTMI